MDRVDFVPINPLKSDIIIETEQLKDELKRIYEYLPNTDQEDINNIYGNIHNMRNYLKDLFYYLRNKQANGSKEKTSCNMREHKDEFNKKKAKSRKIMKIS